MSPSDRQSSVPGSSEAPPASYSILKFIVIFLGILLVLGFAVVIGTVVYRAVNSSEAETAELATTKIAGSAVADILKDIELSLPEGHEISGHDLDGTRLALRLQSPAGDEIWIVDLTSGEVISRVTLHSR